MRIAGCDPVGGPCSLLSSMMFFSSLCNSHHRWRHRNQTRALAQDRKLIQILRSLWSRAKIRSDDVTVLPETKFGNDRSVPTDLANRLNFEESTIGSKDVCSVNDSTDLLLVTCNHTATKTNEKVDLSITDNIGPTAKKDLEKQNQELNHCGSRCLNASEVTDTSSDGNHNQFSLSAAEARCSLATPGNCIGVRGYPGHPHGNGDCGSADLAFKWASEWSRTNVNFEAEDNEILKAIKGKYKNAVQRRFTLSYHALIQSERNNSFKDISFVLNSLNCIDRPNNIAAFNLARICMSDTITSNFIWQGANLNSLYCNLNTVRVSDV